ncbi:MAG TPA: YceI family protein [Rhizomicrobium sp.]|jgi:polyisoprenoid-binding protein YceI|nr:YceI family protein [Rhizomicrobium sp.]
MRKLLLTALVFWAAANPATAAKWNVDYAKSRLGFTVEWSGEPLAARFKNWKADIDFDPKDLAHSHARVTIDLASETSDFPDNDDGMQGAEGFQVSKFPTATFETTKISQVEGSIYRAEGKLTIKGVTRPVTLNFRLLLGGDGARMTGGAEILRTDFGLGTGEWAGEKPVAHRVVVNIELQARKAS